MQVADIKSLPKLILRHKIPYFVRVLRIAALASLLITILAAIIYPFLQPVIPLFYSLSQPEKQLAPKLWIFMFPVFSWLITVLHFIILRQVKNLEGNIEKIFCWTTIGLVGIAGLLFVRVIFLTI